MFSLQLENIDYNVAKYMLGEVRIQRFFFIFTEQLDSLFMEKGVYVCLTFPTAHMFPSMLIWAVCIKGVDTGGVSPATHVILHRWQDTMPSRQQGLPDIEEEEREKAMEDGKE